jgi:ATP-binding protein involved in chromosome partitioning
MSELVCAGCGEHTALFGSGGGAQLSEELGAPLLGRVPLDSALREAGDAGVPVVVSDPASASARELVAVAGALRPVRRSLVGRQLGVDPVPQR